MCAKKAIASQETTEQEQEQIPETPAASTPKEGRYTPDKGPAVLYRVKFVYFRDAVRLPGGSTAGFAKDGEFEIRLLSNGLLKIWRRGKPQNIIFVHMTNTRSFECEE